MIAPRVPVLLNASRPSTVARLVVAIVVDAVEREPWRSSSDVCKEGFERSAPTVTDRDTAPSVVDPVLIPGIKAPLKHVGPCVILRRLPSPVRARLISGITVVTPATESESRAQVLAPNCSFRAAITDTQPHRLAAGIDSFEPKSRQATEPLIGDVNSPWHRSCNYTRNDVALAAVYAAEEALIRGEA